MMRVDIIMGIYNCERYLADSIESILGQTFKEWRLIMCDDNSSDGTLKIAEDYVKRYPEKIILLKNNKNMGLNYTLNKCLKNAKAEYIARQDGDDLSKPDRLRREVDFLDKHRDYAIVSTAIGLFDDGGEWGELYYSEKPTKKDFLKIVPFCHAAVMVRRDAISSVGGYTVDKKLLRVEDYHLWFKMYAAGYKGYNIQTLLYLYRDDRSAAKRRTWKNRMNEYYVRKIGYKMICIPRYLRLYRFRPIILGLLPKSIYSVLHKRKTKK